MGRPKGSKNLKTSKIARARAGYHGKFGEAAQELRDAYARIRNINTGAK